MIIANISFLDACCDIEINPPEWCPHCGRNNYPELVSATDSVDSYYIDSAKFAILYRCSYSDCKKYFPIEYSKDEGDNTKIVEYSYRPPIEIKLPENIEKISPDFVKIYSQATVAEREALDQIAGVGYRKAAEFLIKDYAISKHTKDEENIKAIMLGKVIAEYLNDFPKIQSLAKTIAWIGNDETHYIRRHDNKDLRDLKRFILAAAQFIAADYDAEEALSFTSSE